jgi:hypothetical protein
VRCGARSIEKIAGQTMIKPLKIINKPDPIDLGSESGDEEAREEFKDRTILVDLRPVKTTDFSLSPNNVKFLLA